MSAGDVEPSRSSGACRNVVQFESLDNRIRIAGRDLGEQKARTRAHFEHPSWPSPGCLSFSQSMVDPVGDERAARYGSMCRVELVIGLR